MPSTLGCVGLAVEGQPEFEQLVEASLASAEVIGRNGGVEVRRWQDESGARLIVAMEGRRIVSVLPSFAGEPGPMVSARVVAPDLSFADVLDDEGEQLTALAVELEQHALLGPEAVRGRASLVGLGVGVKVYESEEAFTSSPDSLLAPGSDPGPAPEHAAATGIKWPPRVGGQSFISYGIFGEPARADAYARLNGVVQRAERRTNTLTGQSFIWARVATAGFEADVCMTATADEPAVPAAGAVIGGECFMVGSLDTWTAENGGSESPPPPDDGWLSRLRRRDG